MNSSREKKLKVLIYFLSVLVPLIVVVLFGVKIDGFDFTFLPPVYATINGVTALVLMLAWRVIRMGNKELHRKLMILAMSLSALFLMMYVAYHMTSESTPYGGEGWLRYLYFSILISHILLSVLLVPLVLFSLLRALTGDFDRHKKLAKWVMPIWIYVAISGVLVYLMISPYYL